RRRYDRHHAERQHQSAAPSARTDGLQLPGTRVHALTSTCLSARALRRPGIALAVDARRRTLVPLVDKNATCNIVQSSIANSVTTEAASTDEKRSRPLRRKAAGLDATRRSFDVGGPRNFGGD